MARIQRVAQYIQQLAYETLVQYEEQDKWPDDALPHLSVPSPNYPAWNATSYSTYVPFGGPKSN